MTLIIIGAIFVFLISIVWVWHNLGNIERPKKVAFILVGLCITYFITMILYNIASTDVAYPSEEIRKIVSNTLILIFTGLNALIFLPLIANLLDNILEEEIENKQAKRRIIVIIVIFVICVFVEKGYLKDTQEGIISMYNEVQNAEK